MLAGERTVRTVRSAESASERPPVTALDVWLELGGPSTVPPSKSRRYLSKYSSDRSGAFAVVVKLPGDAGFSSVDNRFDSPRFETFLIVRDVASSGLSSPVLM